MSRIVERPLSPAMASAVALGIVLAAPMLVVRGDWRAFSPANQTATLLQIWLVLVSAQALCWAFLLRWMAPRLRLLIQTVGRSAAIRHGILPTVVLCLVVMSVWLAGSGSGQVPRNIAGFGIIPYVGPTGFLMAAIAMFGLFLEYWSTVNDSRQGSPVERVLRLGEGLSRIHQFLFAAAVVLGLGTIGTGAHRNAVVASNAQTGFKPEHVVMFGVVGSLVLLVGYLPIRLELYQRSERAIADACDAAPKSVDGLKQWADARAAMESLLGHDSKSLFGLSGVISSLLPLVLGSIGKLLAK